MQKLEIIKQTAIDTITCEANEILNLINNIDHGYISACKILFACKGHVVISGMGKSGHIARKISATLASTGTASFFMHPSEAMHGDIGMLTSDDVMICISYSGETQEIISITPTLQRLGIKMISMTGNPQSMLSRLADANINIHVTKEACPHGLAPTSSTTATLVMGDAIAVTLQKLNSFRKEDFAKNHPGGSLGKKLTIFVCDLMHTKQSIPVILPDQSLREGLIIMNEKKLGVVIISKDNNLLGIFTDGDLRRALFQNPNTETITMGEIMTKDCQKISPNTLAYDALKHMQKCMITSLVVTNADDKLTGIVHMHDILSAGVT